MVPPSTPFYSEVKHPTNISPMLHGMAFPATQLLKPQILTSCLLSRPGLTKSTCPSWPAGLLKGPSLTTPNKTCRLPHGSLVTGAGLGKSCYPRLLRGPDEALWLKRLGQRRGRHHYSIQMSHTALLRPPGNESPKPRPGSPAFSSSEVRVLTSPIQHGSSLQNFKRLFPSTNHRKVNSGAPSAAAP